MNLFELFVKIGVDDQASSKIPKIAAGLKNTLSTAAKAGTAAVAAASTGIVALTKNAVDQYADYEQLVGGVDTLFKENSEKVKGYAEEAFETAGLSANDYMATVTSFSASLLQSLGNDTAQTAEYAQRAIIDMSDNANKMGTDMSLIQNAYQGFAKANYTMLDNLKLGYGGTQAEMKRLIEDAAKLSDTVDAQSMSFANVVQAIHVVQTEMGIAGTTAKEAAETISGSAAAMKAAWGNLVVAMADDTADFEGAFDNMLESVGVFAGNVAPRVEIALEGVGRLVSAAAEELPGFVDKAIDGIDEKLPGLLETGGKIVSTVFDAVTTNAPKLLSTGVTILSNFADGVENALSTDGSIGRATSNIIDTTVSFLTNENGDLTKFLGAAGKIVTSLGGYLKDTAINIKEGATEIAAEIANQVVAYVNDPETQLKWEETGKNILSSVAAGLGKYSYIIEEKFKEWSDKAAQAAEDAWQSFNDTLTGSEKNPLFELFVPSEETQRRNDEFWSTFKNSFNEGYTQAKEEEYSDVIDQLEKSPGEYDTDSEAYNYLHEYFEKKSYGPTIPGTGTSPYAQTTVTNNNTFIIQTEAKTEADLAEEIVYAQERAVLTGTQQVLAP